MDLGLEDRVAIVGGSSRGIGRAAAQALLAEGARVVVTGRDPDSLGKTEEELGAEFGSERVLAECADLVAPGEAARVVEAAKGRWGQIDCAIANVGMGSGAPGWDVEDNEWERLFELNFTADRRLAEAVLPGMIEARAGAIVFVASIVGVESVGAPLAYSAAKSALLSYSKNLARQVGEHGIRVNAVAPGNVLFPGGSWERKLAEDRERFTHYVETEVPLQRFARPEEIADSIVFLASSRASFLTGACIVADGGQTRRVAL